MEHKSTTPAAQPVQPAPYAEFACMSYRERLALKHSDPDTYRRLREK